MSEKDEIRIGHRSDALDMINSAIRDVGSINGDIDNKVSKKLIEVLTKLEALRDAIEREVV
jgi:hypothetical protein